ncbi:MAG: YhcH/YjgK/YiaL family protein [Lentisphaerae bacterium]|jgi:biofilm protein TabA|nr:YhcH/YjgK/YiaL family protein [Lentisphaerota bacterium]MBT4820322.1 YhcH/YjgK/YiaL family protein [Lentisphaerota bacterium]MBT5610893.1 YhcH/YjgK/YiaL family protein [Lentisphaerota bacterium]MBT7059513.1 YhcH/YjgK/YiaL family protein [Lentisphaerota bacterium]MBT7846715.1 YhcH/YjgK/YiaL family protein [Lentisphaerota bacterium]
MILDCLTACERYLPLHPDFAAGFAFLQREDLATLEDGRYEIDGDRVFAMVARGAGRGRETAKLEFHKRYIDIQYSVSGTDVIGWRPSAECAVDASTFDADSDCGFFAERPAVWCGLPPDAFMVLYPEDAHAPLAADDPALHKVVVKVAVE